MHQQLSDYAEYNAVVHHFESLTGIRRRPSEIILLTFLLFPDLVRDDESLKNQFRHYADNTSWQELPVAGFENSTILLSQLKDILAASIARRGIIVYYNSKLLRNRVLPGFEVESEIMIHTKKPLTLEVISGVKPLAEPDQQAVVDLIQTLRD